MKVNLDQVILTRFNKDCAKRIAQDMDVNFATVYRRAKQLGLTCNGNRRRAERSLCNVDYFNKWSPNMAYVLGFLFADGSISKLGLIIDVTRSDESVLHFIKNELCSPTAIKHYHYEGSSTNPYSRLCVNSTLIVESVRKLGLLPGKTFRDDPLPEMPDDCYGHFIRGYFDGDGSVFISKGNMCYATFIGTPRLLGGVRDVLVNKANMKQKELKVTKGQKATWCEVYWTHPYDIRQFYNFIYPNSGYGFCLERKRNRFDNWFLIPRRVGGPLKYRRTLVEENV